MQRDDDKRLASSFTLGPQLVEALGLEGRKVLSIRLDVASREVPTVTVTELLTERQGLEVANLLKRRFKLVDAEFADLVPVKLDDSESAPFRP